MPEILEALHESDLLLEGAGPIVAATLVLAVLLFVPREDRHLARVPFLLVVAYLALVVLSVFLPERFAAQRFVRLLGEFLLLLSLGRASFILLMNTVWVKRWVTPLPKIVRDVLQAVIYVFMALVVLRAAGVEPGSLLTTSALLTAVIGLSLQDTLGNLFAGLAIQAQRPFGVGDWIQFDPNEGHVGRVLEINWRAIRILTLTQVEITVPNAAVAKAPIINYSRPTHVARREVDVVAPYSVSPEVVHRLLLQSIRHVPDVLTSPPPLVFTGEFNERGVVYFVRYFIDRFERRELIQSAVRDRCWYALRRAGYEIPVPGRRVELWNRPDSLAPNSRQSIEHRAKLLAELPLFAGMDGGDIMQLAETCRQEEYAPEEYIIRQGEQSTEMFVVERGRVRIEADVDGKEIVISELGRGDFFGEMSLLTGEARTANVVAVGETDVIALGHDSIAPLLEDNPALAERISQVLAERQRRLHEVFGERGSHHPGEPPGEQAELLERIKRFFSL